MTWLKAHKVVALGILVLTISFGVLGYNVRQTTQKQMQPSKLSNTAGVTPAAESLESENVIFTHPVIDPATISHITPLGELNGGYEETQALAGVMFNFKPEAVSGNKEVEVKAPIDMTLDSYSWHKVDHAPGSQWSLIFQVSKEVTLRLDHLSRASDAIKAVADASPKDTSAEFPPKQKLNVKAGEVIAYTYGTVPAHNWNAYVYDTRHKNTFINQKRYETSSFGNRSTGQKLVTATCVFDFYSESLKKTYLDLMGYNKPGQSTTCGSVSHDVVGTASGMWHFSNNASDEIKEERDGVYAAPLSIIKNSGGEVTIDQVGDIRLDVRSGGTLKDPAEVRDTHCYQGSNGGYAYVKIVSETEMMLAASPTSSCPSVFPVSGTKTYYR